MYKKPDGTNTLKPVKSQGTNRRATLSDITRRTLGSGNLRAAVQVPDGEDINEWIAANTVDFYNELSLLYGLAADDAKRFHKPGQGFPPGFEYRWSDGLGKKPLAVSSPEYVDYAMTWIEDQIDNEEIFPVSEEQEFPEDFMVYIEDIFKKMFRIFAIVYHHHFQVIEDLGAAAHLNTSFKHFMFFVFRFAILPMESKDLKALEGPVSRLRDQYDNQTDE